MNIDNQRNSERSGEAKRQFMVDTIRPPKVLISTQNMNIGGGVVALLSFLGPYLREEGYEVTYTFPSRGVREMFNRSKFHIREVDGIRTIQVRSIPYVHLIDQLVAAFSIRGLLDQYEIYQAIGGANFPALPFMMANKPYVCWVATTYEDERRLILHPLRSLESPMRILLYYFNYLLKPLVLWYEKRIYQRAAKILTISRYTAHSIQEQYGIPIEKFSVIPFPIDTDKFKPKANRQQVVAEDFILMVGRITDPRKNVKLLLRAFAQIRQHFPKLKLIIIGQKPENDRLEHFCDELGIASSVAFLGHVAEEKLVNYYTQAKLSVLPSLQEGLGIVVLESMACGTPVVSTKCGGPEEIIAHGKNGYLVENDNAEALAEGVCKLLADEALRRRMGEKAREHILKHYSLEQIKPKFIEVYREVYPHLFDAKD